MTSPRVSVRAVAESDLAEWTTLYRGYRDFYRQPHDAGVFERVWSWLHDSAHETRGLVAEVDGKLVGLAHYRTFARPLSGSHGIFLDDLFTSADARGLGVGTALLAELGKIAEAEGATVVRWITASDNDTARRVYDRVATLTSWATYDLPPGPLRD